MWATDIGRHAASNYDILKVIFEENLKLFGQQAQKKLLFVIRDFQDKGKNMESTKQRLLDDVKKIWTDIYKPECFKNNIAEDFFDFEFAMMPNKIYEEDKFVAKCLELKDRFRLVPENKELKTLFPNSQDKNVPMDGLHVFFEQTWSVIREDK